MIDFGGPIQSLYTVQLENMEKVVRSI